MISFNWVLDLLLFFLSFLPQQTFFISVNLLLVSLSYSRLNVNHFFSYWFMSYSSSSNFFIIEFFKFSFFKLAAFLHRLLTSISLISDDSILSFSIDSGYFTFVCNSTYFIKYVNCLSFDLWCYLPMKRSWIDSSE